MPRVVVWFVEGICVAGFAAGVFAVPWLWVSIHQDRKAWTSVAPRKQTLAPLPAPLPVEPAGPVLAGARSRLPTPVGDEKLIYVDLRSRPQTLTCYEGLRPVMRFTVSGSRLGTDDVGPCRIRRKARRHWYAPERYWMQWWMTLEPLTPAGRKRAEVRGLNGIHTTPVSNYHRLGRPASHGCVRMRLAEARRLWEWTPVGTEVYIYKQPRQKNVLPVVVTYHR